MLYRFHAVKAYKAWSNSKFAVSLPACVTITGPCCSTMDAVTEAFPFEETTPRSMHKVSSYVLFIVFLNHLLFPFSLVYLLSFFFLRGTKVNPMHCLTALMILLKWSHTMIPMVMMNSNSVKFLFTNLFIP